MKLSQLGEFGLIARISANAKNSSSVVTGIGDDAAVTAISPGMQLLTSTDMLLEGVHFRLDWHDPWLLGRKSLAVSISDIAAMGGIPRWALLSLALPAGFDTEYLDLFTQGFLEIASEYGISLIGGDTCSSRSGFVISVTIMGEQCPDLIIRRSGARPGDDIWVTGSLGDAALGLRLLEKDARFSAAPGFDADKVIKRLLDPVPRVAAGLALAGSRLVSSMIDISDGLIADFGHIAEQSGVGGTIELEKLPVSHSFRAAVKDVSPYPHQLVIAGGEDYELAFTSPSANREKIHELMKKSGIAAVPVGIVASRPGVSLLQPDGSHYTPDVSGFTHFL